MRDLLRQVHAKVYLLWQEGPYKRFAKLGGFLAIAFILISGINVIFGSRRDARATYGQSSRDTEIQDPANLAFEFQFIGQGRITGGLEDMWMIGNVPIEVGKQTKLNDDLHPGDFVSLSGRILQNGSWLADRIELSQEGDPFFTFNGPLEWVRGVVWRIGGQTLLTDLQTKIDRKLSLNELLLVTFSALENGGWLALEIKAFERFPIEPTPIASATPTRSPDPTRTPTRIEGSSDRPGSVSHRSGNNQDKKKRPSKSKKNSQSRGKAKGHRKNGKR